MTMKDSILTLSAGRDELVKAGFRVISDHESGSFGDRYAELQRGPWRVQIGLDRGQLFLTLRVPNRAADYDLGLWESCLDNRGPSLEVRDFASDVKVLIRRLPEFDRLLARASDELGDCLRQAGTRRFFARRDEGLITRPSGES